MQDTLSGSMNVTPHTNILIILTDNPMKPLDALYELIDNCIDSFNMAKLKGIVINNPIIDISIPSAGEVKKDCGVIRVRDNGPGLSYEETNNAITAGYSGKNKFDSLGLFGMGFNIATGKMGIVTHFITTREIDDKVLDVTVDLVEISKSKSYNIPFTEKKKEEGFKRGTIVEISDWWPEGNPKRGFILQIAQMSDKTICDRIGRTYSTILQDNKIKIYVNGKLCTPFEHCVWSEQRFVERQKHGKIYAKYNINESIYAERKCVECGALIANEKTTVCPDCGKNNIRTIEERIHGWVGIQRYLSNTEYGIDLIRNGRAIKINEKDSFFTFIDETNEMHLDYPLENNGSGRIVGEIHLDHVPVDYNKQEFQKATPQWNRAISYLRGNSSLRPNQPGADQNKSIIYLLYQGYHAMKRPGKADMYIGNWSLDKEKPVTYDKAKMDEMIERFKAHVEGFYLEEEWWKLVEEADLEPSEKLDFCQCGSQVLKGTEVCDVCGYIINGKSCTGCNNRIKMNADFCPHCGASQILEIEKDWKCEICGTNNAAILRECKGCAEKHGTKLHLSEEYLKENSEQNMELSIKNCIIELSDGKTSSPIMVDVYNTKVPLIPNLRRDSLPYFTVHTTNSIGIYLDKEHRLSKNCSMRPEFIVAYEVAERIYDNYRGLVARYKEHTVGNIVWKLIQIYWIENIEESPIELKNEINDFIHDVFITVQKKAGNLLENLHSEINRNCIECVVNNIYQSGNSASEKIEQMMKDGAFLGYLDSKYLIDIYVCKPELFFDGIVFSDNYNSIYGIEIDIIKNMQAALRQKYRNYVEDIVLYLDIKMPSNIETRRSKLSLEYLMEKAGM